MQLAYHFISVSVTFTNHIDGRQYIKYWKRDFVLDIETHDVQIVGFTERRSFTVSIAFPCEYRRPMKTSFVVKQTLKLGFSLCFIMCPFHSSLINTYTYYIDSQQPSYIHSNLLYTFTFWCWFRDCLIIQRLNNLQNVARKNVSI